MNLIILTESDQIDGTVYCVKDERAEHIRSVLKLTVGETVEVGLLNGPIGQAELLEVNDSRLLLSCLEMTKTPIASLEIDLICALPRPQTLKKVLFISSMMGIRRLHLIRANRVEKSYFHSPTLHPEQQMKHLVEGLSQGKLTRLPDVRIHDRFRRFIEDDFPSLESTEVGPSLRLLPHPDVTRTLSEVSQSMPKRIVVAIGPEGGWVPFELDIMQTCGFEQFTLGPWVLRVEHAVTAVMAQIELWHNQA